MKLSKMKIGQTVIADDKAELGADGKYLQPLEMSVSQIDGVKKMISEMLASHSLSAAEIEYGSQLKRIKTEAEQICELLSGLKSLK